MDSPINDLINVNLNYSFGLGGSRSVGVFAGLAVVIFVGYLVFCMFQEWRRNFKLQKRVRKVKARYEHEQKLLNRGGSLHRLTVAVPPLAHPLPVIQPDDFDRADEATVAVDDDGARRGFDVSMHRATDVQCETARGELQLQNHTSTPTPANAGLRWLPQ